MSINILLTGGTIDKTYDESSGELGFETSHLSKILELGRNQSVVSIQQLMLKDSLQMNDADRHEILKACQNTQQDRIIITHGTDTMVDTARVLGKQDLAKTIVLFGAMVPFVFKHTDAVFNLGFALSSVQTLPVGVYVAMNGKVFDWDNVLKNKEKGVFEETK